MSRSHIPASTGHGRAYIVAYLFPVCLLLFTFLLQMKGEQAFYALRYQRAEILHGEIWRLLSAHLIHLSWTHLLLNSAGLIMIWIIFQHTLTQLQWWGLLIFSMFGVDLGLFLFHHDIVWYIGLSGVLHGLFAGGTIIWLRHSDWRGGLFLLALLSKITLEQLHGGLPGTVETLDARIIVEAHLYGAISGLVVIFLPQKILPDTAASSSSKQE